MTDKPLFSDSGKIVAHLVGKVVVKKIHNNHLLMQPPAIAFDLSVIREAERRGAASIRVVNQDTRQVFTCGMRTFRDKAGTLDRGYGVQLYLVLPEWNISMLGDQPARQPDLFGEIIA